MKATLYLTPREPGHEHKAIAYDKRRSVMDDAIEVEVRGLFYVSRELAELWRPSDPRPASIDRGTMYRLGMVDTIKETQSRSTGRMHGRKAITLHEAYNRQHRRPDNGRPRV